MVTIRKKHLDWIYRENCRLCGSSENRFLLDKEDASYVKCSRCGLVFTNPAPPLDELKQIADEWAQKHHTGEHRLKWEGNPELHRLVYGPRSWRFEQYRYSNRILDVGCATGDFLEYVKSLGWEVYGCELADHTARLARERLNCDVRCGEFESSGFGDGYFDIVTMWDVIEHLTDPMAALAEAWRLLRPGGLLALNTPNYNSITRILLGARWETLCPSRHLFVFSPDTARRIVALSGGRVISVRTVDVNPLDIVTGIFKRKKYGFEQRQENIATVKDIFVRHPGLGHIRAAMNDVLSLFKLGDVLEIYAERAP